jgi:DNA-binding NarL/FixJ family response regulator
MSIDLLVLVPILVVLGLVLYLTACCARRPRRVDKPFKIRLVHLFQPPDELTRWDCLSEREVEIVRSVAGGKSNAEIANALFISKRTVDTHLRHIYDKLGIHERHELTRAAREHFR